MKTKNMQKDKNSDLHLVEILIALILSGILTYFLISSTFLTVQASNSRSMLPTIKPGERSLSCNFEYLFHAPQRGDFIVVWHYDEDGDTRYGKRVVGLPGDVVEIIDGRTYINDELYEEPWLLEEPNAVDFGPFTVPEGHVFVMGDNRNISFDSRFWDDPYVSYDDIIGKSYLVRTENGVHTV